MRKLPLLLLPLMLSPITHGIAEPLVFIEENGLVMMEIESTPAVGGWEQKTAIDDYSGTSYYEWTGPNHFHPASAGEGTLTYHFRISTPGNYELRWRNRIAHGDNATESNDSWLRFPTGTNVADEFPLSGWTKGYMNGLNAWTWTVVTEDHVNNPIRQYFDAGDHTFEISGRSAGHAIDRIALFKYDTVSFNHGTFNGLPESETVGGSTTEPPTEPPVDPEPEPEPDPEPTPDWSAVSSGQLANTCENNMVSLAAKQAIHLQGTTPGTGTELRADGAGRSALLTFDLSTMPAPIESAELNFSIGADNGEGTIILTTGSHSNWSEADSDFSSGPEISSSLGSFTDTWDAGQRYALPFSADLLGNADETLMLSMSAGDNDISILSRLDETGDPRLLLSGSGDFCQQYDQLVEEARLSEIPNEEEEEDDGQSEEETDAESEEAETTQSQAQQTASGQAQNGSGALDLLLLLLTGAVLLWRLRSGSAAANPVVSRAPRQPKQPPQPYKEYRR